jgi:hypothetical protein
MKRIIAVVLLLGLCACGSRGGGAVEGGAGAAEPPPRAAASASVETERPAGQVAREAARSAADAPKQLCAFLKDEVPRIKAHGSRLTALAGFAADYAGWIGRDANRALAVATELDEITSTSCPKLRRQVLSVLDRDSLAKAVVAISR